TINGNIVIYGGKGDDTFVFDDTLAPMTVHGDEGNDNFQIGQVYQSARDGTNPGNGLQSRDQFETTLTTRGWLSNGISKPAALYGGDGNDVFTVYRNLAELYLFGENDDDTFRVRAFVRVNPNDPKAPFTNVNGGQGADFINYTVDSPVRIDGGDGLDTLVVVGTEFGDDIVVTNKGVFGAGLFVTYAGIEKVTIDAQEGDDRFYVLSSAEDVILELVGGRGSDSFNVGGNNGEPITVVSNSLGGHSGLINNLIRSADSNYNDIFVQGLSVQIADNDTAGVVITQPTVLTVMEGPNAPINLAYAYYTIVLSRAPEEETVQITAAPVAQKQSDRLAGAKSVALWAGNDPTAVGVNPQFIDSGVALSFNRTNWFIPQKVWVLAPQDTLAEGTRSVLIQHDVIQGSTPDDGGAYDGLAVPGVAVTVYDQDSQDVVLLPVASTGTPVEQLTVAENPGTGTTSLPGQAQYQVMLTKTPTGPVTFVAMVDDGQTQLSLDGTTWVTCVAGQPCLPLTFNAAKTAQTIYIKAENDTLREGVHFGRIRNAVTSDTGALLGLTSADVAQGLVNAIKASNGGKLTPTLSGPSEMTITGAAFSYTTATSLAGAGFGLVSSAPAYEADLTATITSVALDQVFTVTLNGATYTYKAAPADVGNPGAITQKLADLINNDTRKAFDATPTAGTLAVHSKKGPYSASMIGGTLSAPDSTTYLSSLTLTVSAPATIALGARWTLSVAIGTQIAIDFVYLAGSHGENSAPGPIDAKILDDDAPSALVLESGGSTHAIEPSSLVVLGTGFVVPITGVSTTTTGSQVTITGDFGTSVLKETTLAHDAIFSAQDLDLGKWSSSFSSDIANSLTRPHLTLQGTGDGHTDFYKFSVSGASSTSKKHVTFDIDHGFVIGDPILWASLLTL
ncbi:MAG: mucin9, partial [Acidimicrobiaceae bacterium]